MELDIYFNKVEFLNSDFASNSIGEKIQINNGLSDFPDLTEFDIVIFWCS